MSTARHIYVTLPDEAHKRSPRPARCKIEGCHNFALIDGLCMRCEEEITALESWAVHQMLKSKRRAEMRARFIAKAWDGLKLWGGISLYLGALWLIWRAIW